MRRFVLGLFAAIGIIAVLTVIGLGVAGLAGRREQAVVCRTASC